MLSESITKDLWTHWVQKPSSNTREKTVHGLGLCPSHMPWIWLAEKTEQEASFDEENVWRNRWRVSLQVKLETSGDFPSGPEHEDRASSDLGKEDGGIKGTESHPKVFLLPTQLEFEVDEFSWFSHYITRKRGKMDKIRNVPKPAVHTVQCTPGHAADRNLGT